MRRFFALIITILLVSCTSDSDTYKIDGTAEGIADGTQILVYNLVDNDQPVAVDTLEVIGGKFSATYPKTDQLMLGYLSFQNPKGSVVFIPENEDLKVTVFKDSMTSSYVSGSRQNDMYREYGETMRGFNARKRLLGEQFQQARREQDNLLAVQIQQQNAQIIEEEKNYKFNFIQDNTNSIFSLMVAAEMLNRKEMSADQANDFIGALPPKTATSKLVGNMKSTIAAMKKASVGEMAPDFSAPTPEGGMLSLKETMGKYTIIDFWASWCRPCRIENPNVVRVYEKYHEKGLNIISVSLDRTGQKERWVKAIADDKMDWYHVSNLKYWQDPIARMYNVKSIPATFLIDENGTIIAKNLRGPALESKIASLLGP